MNELIFVFDILSVLCQFAAVYFSYKIYTYNRLSKWWLALMVAFFIQGVRRAITFYEDLYLSVVSNGILLDRTLMFVISMLIIVGLWAMLRNFESFEIVEKKTNQAIKEKFQKKKKL
jgi:hypothetical protein